MSIPLFSNNLKFAYVEVVHHGNGGGFSDYYARCDRSSNAGKSVRYSLRSYEKSKFSESIPKDSAVRTKATISISVILGLPVMEEVIIFKYNISQSRFGNTNNFVEIRFQVVHISKR